MSVSPLPRLLHQPNPSLGAIPVSFPAAEPNIFGDQASNPPPPRPQVEIAADWSACHVGGQPATPSTSALPRCRVGIYQGRVPEVPFVFTGIISSHPP
ncbi:hypothetical protein B0T18DRAFT_156925 [Schizothecium vesticola]|uniref:Uncharacterized protein n=1 Tax=Schizothecium vesticola TaxID=314040 RepID=A0AA40K5W3_9PEZI|nr:hypothetical protein B0T18DRAFT_156925 [Schizothecium vesticola]